MGAGGISRAVLAGSIGFASGSVIAFTSPFHSEAGWPAWAALAIVLTTTSGTVFVYGSERWVELRALNIVRVRDVLWPILALVSLSVLLFIGQLFLTSWSGTWRGTALVALTFLGGSPALGVMFGIGVAGRATQRRDSNGDEAATLIELQRLLQRLLPSLGSLVALSTLALGAAMSMRNRPLPRTAVAALPPEAVIFFGAVGSLLVGLAYVPAASALRRRAQRLCDELFPIGKVNSASTILKVADQRHRLEQLLGADRSTFVDFQTGLLILGPLLASAAASFLPA